MKLIHSELVEVTPETAGNWLATANYERQRKRADWHVNRLATEMKKERFIPGTQIHFGILRGTLKLVNGQHTLAGIVRSGIPLTLSVLYTEVENEVELGQLYGRHDRHRQRTPHDAFLGMNLAERLALSEPEVNAFGSGLKWVLANFRRASVHHADVEVAGSLDYLANEMDAWSHQARAYFECVREARLGMRAIFKRAPVVAVGLATMKHQEAKAREFWLGCANDGDLPRLDPRRALNAFLLAKTSTRADPIQHIRHTAWAWNKFMEGAQLQFLRPGDSGKSGVTIKGTPYKAQEESREKEKEVGKADDCRNPSAALTAPAGAREARL